MIPRTRVRCISAAAFGVGLIAACLFPSGLMLFIAGIIIIILGLFAWR